MRKYDSLNSTPSAYSKIFRIYFNVLLSFFYSQIQGDNVSRLTLRHLQAYTYLKPIITVSWRLVSYVFTFYWSKLSVAQSTESDYRSIVNNDIREI
jgi:hypothetical protein